MSGPRMTRSTQLVLRELLADPAVEKYGLEVCKAVGLVSGIVHPLLNKFERLGWLRSRLEESDSLKAGRPRRRYYQFTVDGIDFARDALMNARSPQYRDVPPLLKRDDRMSTTESTGLYELAALLAMFRDDLHGCYANTSRRGRGIGGQTITTQCHYVDPEGNERRIIDRIDEAIQQWFHRAQREGVDMLEVRQRLMSDVQGRLNPTG